METIVMKFGGTSVSSTHNWETIRKESKLTLERGQRPFLVCSALSGVSNILERLPDLDDKQRAEQVELLWEKHHLLGHELGLDLTILDPFKETLQRHLNKMPYNDATRAEILSMGELLSTTFGYHYLKQFLPIKFLDARRWLKSSCENHSPFMYLQSSCHYEKDEKLISLVKEESGIIITQGFLCSNNRGETCLLGRGGSDTSAAYFSAKLAARKCEIWTDVPGLFTANPNVIPQARPIKKLHYHEAQEMASLGAKVLHPRCLVPVEKNNIPLHIRWTQNPSASGTLISQNRSNKITLKAVCKRTPITLLSVESVGMWHEVGYLAKLFTIMSKHDLSIDLLSTSQTNVTMSLDSFNRVRDGERLNRAVKELKEIGEIRVHENCAAVSLVGNSIRQILTQLSPFFETFEDKTIYMMSQASNDLNITFVVHGDLADKVEADLHHQLIPFHRDEDLFDGPIKKEKLSLLNWWKERNGDLLSLGQKGEPLYVYNPLVLKEKINSLKKLKVLDNIFYAIKANSFSPLIKEVSDSGLGLECVSKGELDKILNELPGHKKILFTPNFAPLEEYLYAFSKGVTVTLDNLFILEHWGKHFKDKSIFLRLDPGKGKGHHRYVKTAGDSSKFGLSLDDIEKAVKLCRKYNIKVIGLHAHSGSFISGPKHWSELARFLVKYTDQFPEVRVLNLGGGLSVPSSPGQEPFDLEIFAHHLKEFKDTYPQYELWIEPGRYIAAECGVLIAQVTQYKKKGNHFYVGLNAGMHSLIRPSLYGAYHHIENLSRDENYKLMDVVGPTCESGDTLGHHRLLPQPKEGDIFLIACAGAYGKVMSSTYNLRGPIEEIWLD